jgi:colicin import membrane protein
MHADVMHEYPDPGKITSAVLAVLVHLVLFSVLYFGVQWQTSEPESVTVELWDRMPSPPPSQAAPEAVTPPPEVKPEPAPEPTPEPVVEPKAETKPEPAPVAKVEPKPIPKAEPKPTPKPDIALKEKLEKKKKEELKVQREEQQKAEDAKRLQAEREQLLKEQREKLRKETQMLQAQREVAQEQNRLNAQRAAASSRAANDYGAKIKSKIRANIAVPEGIAGNPEAIFDVVQLPSGDVLTAKLRTSSGHAGFDLAVERAILKSSPLPKPDDPTQFQRTLVLKFKPHDVN